MKSRMLIAIAGAAIIASATALAGTSAASAAVPAFPSFNIPFDVGGGCEGLATITEYSDSSHADVEAFLNSDPCNIGAEGAICSSAYTTCSYGGDIRFAEEISTTGLIPASSGNHHGIRWWTGTQWQYNWHD